MTMKERDRAKFEARKLEHQERSNTHRRSNRREIALERIARFVYDTDRDDFSDISDESASDR